VTARRRGGDLLALMVAVSGLVRWQLMLVDNYRLFTARALLPRGGA
jgi:hypothetical protein